MAHLVPLSPAFGVEVLEMDLAREIDPDDVSQLREAFKTHKMLLLRDQQALSNAQHIAFANLFGIVADEYLDGAYVGWVTNRPDAKTTVQGESKLHWHSDYSFTKWPLRAISLQAVELSGRGAATRFASTARAWSALPDALRAEVEPLTVLHLADFSGEAAVLGLQEDHFGKDPDPELFPHTWHPLMLLHPDTQEPLLFVNEFLTVRVGGVSPEKSRALLKSFWPILYDADFVYEHEWREGDLLIWDNLALQHGRDDFTPAPGVPVPIRTLRRISLSADYQRMRESVSRMRRNLSS